MRKCLVEKHFINSEDTFREYATGINSIIAAIDVSKSHNYGFEFGLNLTVDTGKVDRDLQERIKQETGKLPPDVWLQYSPENRGPGTSYRKILFNPAFFNSITISADLDQYIIDTEEALEQLAELTQRVEIDGALYATGSRDVPVVLATHQRNNGLRIIHELFHSLTIGSDKLKVEEKRTNVTPAYAEIGESTSGLYAINLAHAWYPDLNRSIVRAAQIANMDGFATDYYVATKSTQLGRFSKGYVKSKENTFYTKKGEQEELESVKKLIYGQTRELGKTDISSMLLAALMEERNTERISGFYPTLDVEFVRDFMLSALKQKN